MIVSAASNTIAGRSSLSMFVSSDEVQGVDGEVDRLDADERDDHAAKAVDEKVAPQQRACADRTIGDAVQRQRDQRDDDQRVEDDRRQDGALRASPGP